VISAEPVNGKAEPPPPASWNVKLPEPSVVMTCPDVPSAVG